MAELKPWSEVVRLHPLVEAGETQASAYAIDLGALVEGDPDVPAVYRDADAFFRATYVTQGIRRLLEDVFAALAGEDRDRVLQLRSPFGGGKTHALAVLYHAARSPEALRKLPEVGELPDPGQVGVAVFDGEKMDPLKPKVVSDGTEIWTMWGWLAWQLGGEELFELVREHDEQRVAPGGEVIAQLIGEGPTLLLLDEVLQYVVGAEAVGAGESNFGRQVEKFLQALTVEVARTKHAVLVYSLQTSRREAMEHEALLQTLDHLTSRVDAKREPVTGDEILPVLHRRLLAEEPPREVAEAVAEAYAGQISKALSFAADAPEAARDVDEAVLRWRERLVASYPFHPALIDVMRERWASVPAFQQTRGALRFLAACLHALKRDGRASALLAPSDVPLNDHDVRRHFLSEMGATDKYDPVLLADIVEPRGRAPNIDERLGREDPAVAAAKPATRVATAIVMYSFGGLPREGRAEGEAIPAGVTENELAVACVGPDIDRMALSRALSELKKVCLYLHFDGTRYCFKTTPNVVSLIEQEAGAIKPQEVNERLRSELERRLSGEGGVVIWPEASNDIPDEEAAFLLAYLPVDFAYKPAEEQERIAKQMFQTYGDRPRRYRNGLGLAVPDRRAIEGVRRSLRYLMAIERVEKKRKQLGVTKDQEPLLRERRETEEGGVESGIRQLYSAVWLPRVEEGAIEIERVEAKGRPLQSEQLHARLMELLMAVALQRLFGTLKPTRIIQLMGLGEETEDGQKRLGVSLQDVCDAFFGVLGFPRLVDASGIVRAVCEGVEEGLFGYCGRGKPELDEDGRYQVPREHVVISRAIAEDEVDISAGFLMLPEAIPEPPKKLPQPQIDPVPAQTSADKVTITGTAEAALTITVTGGAETVSCGVGQDGRFSIDVPLMRNVLNRLSIVARDDSGGESDPVLVEVHQGTAVGPGPGGGGRPVGQRPKTVQISFRANRPTLFTAWDAIANLADAAGEVQVQITAQNDDGFDPIWLRNAVEEPLEETVDGVELSGEGSTAEGG